MASKQVRAIQSMLAVALFAITSELVGPSQAAPFASLFQRASLIRRNHQQQQQQQQQQKEHPPHPGPFVPLASNYSPRQLASNGQLGQMHPAAELLRISGMHQPAQSIGAHQMQQPPQFMNPAASFALAQHAHPQTNMIYQDDDSAALAIGKFDSAPQAAAYYKSNMVRPLASLNGPPQHNQHQRRQPVQQPALVLEQSFDTSDNSNYFRDDSGGQEQPASQAGRQAAAPTHTSEIVDKIEQHIENKIEQSMKEDEKESSASEEPEEHGEHKRGEGGGGEGGGEGGEEKREEAEEKKEEEEKEKEQKHKPEVHEQHHQHEHHEHHMQMPPEAFEVHHKKGGKSYQYFHQGHSHP